MSHSDDILRFNEVFSKKVLAFPYTCQVVVSELRYVLDASGLAEGSVEAPYVTLSMTSEAFHQLVVNPAAIMGLIGTRKISASPSSAALQVAMKLKPMMSW